MLSVENKPIMLSFILLLLWHSSIEPITQQSHYFEFRYVVCRFAEFSDISYWGMSQKS